VNETSRHLTETLGETPFQIGVIVLTYNQAELLRTCLDSVISQKLNAADLKIYVIDDASTDGTRDIIEEYVNNYPNLIIPIFYEVNQYQNGNPPEFPVMKRIEASHIAFCDGDDYWIDVYKLEKQIQLFRTDNSLAIVHTDYYFGKVADDNINIISRSLKDRKKAVGIRSAQDLIQGNDIKKSTALFRKTAIDFSFLGKCAGVRAQDWLVAVSASSSGGIYFIDEPTVLYRVSSDASFQSLNQEEKLRIKDEVRWFCATNLPEGELRHKFRKFLFHQEVRKLISKNPLYKTVRPLVMLTRLLKLTAKRWT